MRPEGQGQGQSPAFPSRAHQDVLTWEPGRSCRKLGGMYVGGNQQGTPLAKSSGH